jgi:hypothetical protein
MEKEQGKGRKATAENVRLRSGASALALLAPVAALFVFVAQAEGFSSPPISTRQTGIQPLWLTPGRRTG